MAKLKIFDTHAHLDDRKYDQDREEMLQRAREAGVERIVNVGYDLSSSRRSLALAEKYDFIYAAVGIHPHDSATANEDTWKQLLELAAHPKVVALGEMGLDYYRDLSPRPVQQGVFAHQMELAQQVGKPVIIHDRDAHADLLAMVKESRIGEKNGGVFHCFSGSWEMAKVCLDLGFYISIAGPVTFHNARKLTEVAAKVPLERLLIETDAPYLTPEPYRGKRNESAYVVWVLRKIAELRQMDPEELAVRTFDNACQLFRI
ncbi:TatD DNase family protein [Carboxydocella thermautotrophica]|nr:TatD DNase family protein [Carboxydocella thermautotrophica]